MDILKIVNWKCTVSVIIHNNSSLSSGSRYCKPEVISWWKVNITVFYARFLSPTGQKCAESSAFWQFFYYITSLLKVFFSNVKKTKTFFFQKLAGLWFVREVANHVGLYGSKVAEGCSAFQRRSCFHYIIRGCYSDTSTILFTYLFVIWGCIATNYMNDYTNRRPLISTNTSQNVRYKMRPVNILMSVSVKDSFSS